MPPYELTIITRCLSKPDLFTTLKRAATTLLNHGAVIENFHSLGHRDLPYRRVTKSSTKDPVYSSNYFLINSHMPIDTMHSIANIMRNDKDLVHFYALNAKEIEEQSFECDLSKWLQPPAYRKSVEDLRAHQHLNRKNKRRYYLRAMREWKVIPKSYFISPSRK